MWKLLWNLDVKVLVYIYMEKKRLLRYIDKITEIPIAFPNFHRFQLRNYHASNVTNKVPLQANNYNTHLSKQPKLGLSDFSQVISFIHQTCLDYRLCHLPKSSEIFRNLKILI